MGGFITFIRMWHYFDSNRLVFPWNLILLCLGDSINSTAILGCFDWMLIEFPEQSALTFPVLCFVSVT